jgi:sugar phosphate isomerase/epimerase
MLLSIVSSLDETTNNLEAILRRFSSLCALLKPLNYDGIELSLLEPEKIKVEKLLEIMESYQMKVPALGTGSTYIRFGYSLGDADESIRKKAINQLQKYLELGGKINSKVIIGLIRGRYKYDSNIKKEKAYILSSLNQVLKIAEENDVELLFEPINRFEVDSYNTISQSIELLDDLKTDKIKLLIDSFHTYLEEDPVYVWETLQEIAHRVGHLHLADTTRRAPGSGYFDFKAFLSIFKQENYKGFASIETIMKPSFEEVARNSAEYLDSIL